MLGSVYNFYFHCLQFKILKETHKVSESSKLAFFNDFLGCLGLIFQQEKAYKEVDLTYFMMCWSSHFSIFWELLFCKSFLFRLCILQNK